MLTDMKQKIPESYQSCSPATCVNKLNTADFNMYLPSAVSAVPTCRLSHVILQERTLILLHCPSRVNSCTKSTSFHSILAAPPRNGARVWFELVQNVARGLKEKSSAGWRKWERSLSQLSFLTACWWIPLSLSPAWPTLAACLPTSLSYKLSLHWFGLIWCVELPKCDTLISYKSKHKCKTVSRETSSPSLLLNYDFLYFSIFPSLCLSLIPSCLLHISSEFSHLYTNITSSVFLSMLLILLQLCFCCSDPPPNTYTSLFLCSSTLWKEITAPHSDGALATLNQPQTPHVAYEEDDGTDKPGRLMGQSVYSHINTHIQWQKTPKLAWHLVCSHIIQHTWNDQMTCCVTASLFFYSLQTQTDTHTTCNHVTAHHFSPFALQMGTVTHLSHLKAHPF